MARYIGPVCRLCRREGMKLFLKGERCHSEKCAIEKRNFFPASTARTASRRSSATACSCARSRRPAASTACSERQFRNTVREGRAAEGHHRREPAANLERRLDNVIYRMGFGTSRAQAARWSATATSRSTAASATSRPSMVKAGRRDRVREKQQEQSHHPGRPRRHGARARRRTGWKWTAKNLKGRVHRACPSARTWCRSS